VRLLQRFADPDVTLSSITDIIRPDPAITASILRAASSAEFGVGRALTDLTRAVGLLGVRRVASLALCFSLSEDSMNAGPFRDLYREIWRRSIVQALSAELLAKRRTRGAESEHFTAGLLADIGRLAMLKAAPQEYASMVEQIRKTPDRENVIQLEVFGMTHSDVAIAMYRQWRLPPQFSNAIRTRDCTGKDLCAILTGEHRPLQHGIAMASALAAYLCDEQRETAIARVCELGGMLYGMSLADVQDLLDSIVTRTSTSAALFKVDVSAMGTAAELMAQAREHLNRLQGLEDEADLVAVT